MTGRRDGLMSTGVRMAGGLVVRAGLGVALYVCFGLVMAGSASARTVTVDFERVPPLTGQPVTSDYELLEGVTFNEPAPGLAKEYVPVIKAPGAAIARSGERVLSISNLGQCRPGEFVGCEVDLWGKFRQPQRRLRFSIGRLETWSEDVWLNVEFYDVNGELLPGSAPVLVPKEAGVRSEVCVAYADGCAVPGSAPELGDAVYFRIRKQHVGTTEIAIDDLQFWEPDPGTPQVTRFGLTRAARTLFTDEVGVAIGGSAQFDVRINRVGPVGRLEFSLEAPTRQGRVVPDISATFEPRLAYAGDNTVKVTVSALADVPAQARVPVEVVARRSFPVPGVQNEARLKVPVTLVREYDPEVTGMLVTQAIQPTSALATISGSGYSGVSLAAFQPTVVRVFADLVAGPEEGVPLTMSLSRIEGGRTVSTIFPLRTPRTTAGDADNVGPRRIRTFPDVESRDINRGFTFLLPRPWTAPNTELKLVARVHPRDSAEPYAVNQFRQCNIADCRRNDSFELTGVKFAELYRRTIHTVDFRVNGRPPEDAYEVFRQPTPLFPMPIEVIDTRSYYNVDEDIGYCDLTETDREDRRTCIKDQDSALLDRVKDFLDTYRDEYGRAADLVVGIVQGYQSAGVASGDSAGAVVQANRPFTSVAHEVGHLLGRIHADLRCGGHEPVPGLLEDPVRFIEIALGGHQVGEDATGDGGYGSLFNFLGFDFSGGPGGRGDFRHLNWRVVGPPSPVADKGAALPFTFRYSRRHYDFMSYCADEADAWVSQYGWELLSGLNTVPIFAPRAASAARSSVIASGTGVAAAATTTADGLAGAQETLRVSGFDTPEGPARITTVRSSGKASEPPDPDSPYRLVVENASGTEIANVPMAVARSHVDGAGRMTSFSGEAPLLVSAGGTPAQSAPATVRVTARGRTVASRTRSPNAPTVKLRAPRRGQRVGRRKIFTVAWHARDRDGDRLTASVDFSADDGRSWRPLARDLRGQRVRLSSRTLQGSRRARLRVRVNDGFNDAIAISRRFVAVGHGPSVRILSPGSGARITNDSPLPLSGQAVDEDLRLLPARRLRWYAGRRPIAQGTYVTPYGLRPGRTRIRLIARGRSGRIGRTSIVVHVIASVPKFLRLDRPAQLPLRARRLRLRVAASVPSTLSVSGRDVRRRRASVSQQPKRITIAVRRRARRALVLRLRLRSGPKVSTVRLSIPRR